MIVIFNLDGSVYDSNFSDYVQQGSNGANMLQVAYVDSSRDGLSAYLVAERPNGTIITLPARRASFFCNGERYSGWEIAITGSFTLYAGVVHCTLNVVDEDDNIIANYPFDVTVNETGNPISGDWDEKINIAQYNEYMAQLSGKATVKRVDSFDNLPHPGQRSVIYLVGGGTSYGAYAWDPDLGEYRAMGDAIYVVADITSANLSGYGEGQIFYDKASDSYYVKTATSPYYEPVNDKGVLGAPHVLCRSDATHTIEELHTTYGDSRYIVLSYLDKDFIYFSKKTGATYTCVAFDTEEQRFYKASGLSGSALPSSVLIPGNKIEIASKAFLANNYVPYNGANADVNLNGRYISNAKVDTDHNGEYHDTYKADDYKQISNVAFVLCQSTEIEDGKISSDMYRYFLKENATLLCGGLLYKKLTETADDLIYTCLNASITAITDGTTVKLGRVVAISKTEVSGAHSYTEADLTIDLYSKTQAQAKFGTSLAVSIDPTNYVMTLTLKNANNVTLSTQTVDLPLESIVSGATYYDTYTYDGTTYTKVIVITLSTTSVPTIVPVGDLISGLEKEACVEIPVSPASGTFTSAQMELLALDNASIKIGGYTYLHKVLANQFIAKSAFASSAGYKTESEYKVVVQNNGNYTLTSTTIEFYDKDQIDAKIGEMPQPPANAGYYGCKVDDGTPSYEKFDYDFDDESENALQNKVITKNLSEKLLDEEMVVSDTISVLTGYYVSKTTGQLNSDANSYYSDFISTSGMKELYVSSKSNYDTCIIASYDENQDFIRSYGDTTTWDAHKFVPQADEKYIRVCGYTRPFVIFSKAYTSKLSDTDNKVNKIMEDYFHNDPKQPQGIVVSTGKCLITSTGQLSDVANSYYTDYIRTNIAKKFYITAFSRWSTCIMATYDKDHRLIRVYGAGTDNGVYYDKEEYVPQNDEYYVVFSSLYTPLVVAVDHYSPYVADDVDTRKSGYVDITENFELRDGYYGRTDGNFASLSGAKATQIFPVSQGELYKISGDAQYSTSLIVTFDKNMTFKRAYGVDGGNHVISEDFEFTPQSDEYYVAFGTYRENTYPLTIKKYKKVSMYEWVQSIQKDLDNTFDVLKGKKYVACGDSFTSDNGNSAFKGKTYPDLIAKRNGMKLLNMAKSGTYAHNGQDGFTNSSNSFYYQNIPQDADYVTIAYGLNETGATIGDSSSSDNTTIWGAYNEILAWLIENRPNAKIGIISNDAWQTIEMRNALKEISAFWGVSFLDLKEYGKPLMIGGKFASDGSVSSSAVNLRNAQYQVSGLDSHPNVTAHAVRSTIIEEWLRGM